MEMCSTRTQIFVTLQVRIITFILTYHICRVDLPLLLPGLTEKIEIGGNTLI